MNRKSNQGRSAVIALATCCAAVSAALYAYRVTAEPRVVEIVDPVLQPGGPLCVPGKDGAPPPLLRQLMVAKTETAPFTPPPPQAALDARPRLYGNLGSLRFPVTTTSPRAQAFVEQGMKLAFGFNHAEAQRAFREAQRLDPACAMCFWGEALVLGPNINAPMAPEAQAPALAALGKAKELAASASPRERDLIAALDTRYSADPKAERPALDRAFAAAMKDVAKRHPADDTIQVLYAEAVMDTQPWDYWEAGGTRPKGDGGEIVGALERVLRRNPQHIGAIHYYIHAMEASSQVDKALPHARRLAALSPGAGHLVHMPAHIYYRLGLYRESLEANKRAIAVDERYFETSPSDPMYRAAYYPHNVHFVMVSAQMGGDGRTAIEAARKMDAVLPAEVVQTVAALQPVKASIYTTHAQFSDPATILALPAAPADQLLVKAMSHYARGVAHAMKRDAAGVRAELDALTALEGADYKAFAEWGVPAKEIVQTAKLVIAARLADAQGDLDGAARAYEQAVALEDALSYMEPPFWYYPIRQSLGSVRLRQGRLEDAERAFRDSLARVRNNGWALAGLAETYKRMGDAKREAQARKTLARAWFGPAGGPDLGRL